MNDTSPLTRPREFLTALFHEAVSVADPMHVVAEHLPEPEPGGGRLVIIGAGKASARMAEAAEAHHGPGTIEGFVITRYGYARPCRDVEIAEAAHPVPDQAGVNATQRLLELVAELTADDQVVALISGGGSALLCAPRDGLTLDDKIAVNDALLASGAPIGEMNVVRKHLSRIKGGQLAAACYPAKLRSLMISDVPGDNPAMIASGPTVGDSSTAADALAILDRHALTVPDSVRDALGKGSGVLPEDDPRLALVDNRIIAAPSRSLEAAAAMARRAGCDVELLGDALEGEAREVARAQVTLALGRRAAVADAGRPLLLLSGGECTVTRHGNGSGGPNAEFVLAAALALDGAPHIHVLAGDTDGVDGAAEVAGAVAGPHTLELAAQRGLDPRAALENNDAHGFFERIESQLLTGPTLTNVNDFRAILIQPST
ncbi:MAG: glycerate kinase [Gammaproteobacteria bacterium]|nr:MAG: glycerate kinase [Gammaproteobacteria bacterium]